MPKFGEIPIFSQDFLIQIIITNLKLTIFFNYPVLLQLVGCTIPSYEFTFGMWLG